MSNVIKFCSCRMCKRGKHTKTSRFYSKIAMRRLRRETKVALRQGREPERLISIPYTD